jgi:hypothetical protein
VPSRFYGWRPRRRRAALHSLDGNEPLVIYLALKARIHAIAQEKYRKQLKDENGVVVLHRNLGAI